MTRNLSVQTKVSTLALAAALAAAPSPAVAQFVGTIDSSSGIDTESSTNSNLIITGQQAVINWTATNDPVDSQIVFLPDGNSATFNGSSNFAVLNRVTPGTAGNPIYMGGNINSLIGGEITGGTVFFYSPNGIIIGQNAVINVGSLGLSTLPIDDLEGIWVSGFGTADMEVVLGQATDPNSFIRTNAAIDGSIRSNGAGSYVALVAPRIHHQGRILTDGTAALVAAEAATIRFDPFGLFDIVVTTGTDAGTGIHVDGGTIDRNSETVSSDNIHRAYLVAVAKNDAVTMLINNGASVGFEIGTSASVEDNAVVISGGYNVENGDHQFFGTSGVSNVPLTITNATLSSHVDAQVTGGAAINSGEGALTFGGDLSIIGGETTTSGGNVLIDALNGNDLTIGGDLYARAFRRTAEGSEVGLITRLGATGGSLITIGTVDNPGDVELDSDSFGATIGEFQETGLDATGGNAQVNIQANSTLNVTGSMDVHADGHGGFSLGNGAGGDGIGGQALVMAIFGNATVTVGGSVTVSSQGFGGGAGGDNCQAGCGVTGGNGIGGSTIGASIHANGGSGNSIQILGDVTINASGHGGDGDVQAGAGIGGTANLGAADGSSVTIGELEGDTVVTSAGTEVISDGFGGDGFDNQGGLGRGGTARIGTNSGGSIDLTGPVFVTANGEGGSSSVLGGTGTGGLANVSAFLGTVHAFNNMSVSAHSSGGFAFGSGTGGDGLADIETAITSGMTEASLFAGGGTLTVDGLTVVSAGATGGNGGFDGGDGGNAVAAGVAGRVLGGAIIHAGNSDAGPSVIRLGGVTVAAEASGGAGGDGQGGVNGGDGGNGGSATGGKAIMTAAAGSGDLTAGAVIISASAVGGNGGSGSGGDGGSGGNGGDGGNATGGFINIGAESGNINLAQGSNPGVATYTSILSFANAFGGNGGNAGFGSPAGVAGDGGDAIGGDNALLVRGAIVNVGSVNLVSNANGGNGGFNPNESQGGVGGDAVAGVVGVLVTNRFELPDQRGTLNAGAVDGLALATGGAGAIGGGQWTRGGTFFEVVNSEATIDSVNLVVGADGVDPNATETFASYVAVVDSTVDIAGGFNLQTPGRVSIHVDDSTPLTTALTVAGSFSVSGDTFVHDETRDLPASIGTISADSINLGTGGDLIVDAHLVSTASLSLSAPGLVDIEDATSGGEISGSAGTSFTAGTLTAAGLVSLTATDAISLDLVNAGTDIIIQSFDGSIDSNGMSSEDGSIFLDGETSISTGPLTAAGNVMALSRGDITLGDTSAGGFIDIFTSGGSIWTQDLAAATFIDLEATGSIGFGDATADELDFDAGGNVLGGNIIAGTFAGGQAGGTVTLENISVGIEQEGGATEDGFAVGIAAEGSITVGDVEADEAIGFATLANLTAGDLDAGTDVLTLVGGNTTIASITASDRVYHGDAQMFLDAGGPDEFDPALVFAQAPVRSGGSYTVTGAIDTGQLQVGAASISTGAISAFNSASLDAAGAVITGSIDTGLLQITAGTDISTGDIFAFDGVDMNAGGSILTGNIDAGSIDLFAGNDITVDGYLNTQLFFEFAGDGGGIGTLLFPGASITLEAEGDISTGDISSIDGVYANAGGSILTGTIDAFDFVEAHAGTSLTTDDIDAGDYVLLTAGTNLSANAISASVINASAGGTATVGGSWNSGTDVQLTSNDIDIAANGSISGGDIALISTNATQTVVGDGVAGGGYQLSDAEYDRLNANDINVIADSGLGAAPLMLIGDLSVDASGIDGNADYEFITGDSETESAGGSIRILGEAVFTGMDADDAVGFTTGTFELDAATGLLSLENAPGTLGGTLFLNAARIHVASGEILDQLAEDPQYDGYQDDLNAPAEEERPDGVIRAESIEIEFGDAGESQLNTLYVQNTGSEETPAGFVVSDLNLGDDGEAGIPVGSVDLIINGQIVTEGGTLTGIDVRDLLVEARDLTPFTENSTINGCLLTGSCDPLPPPPPPEPPFPPGFNPAGPGIQDEVTLIDDNILPPPEFGNEDVIDDNDEDTEDDSPITPPNPLFDTSELGDAGGTVGPEVGTPMRSSPGLTETGDIDDPVSGSGNPALTETPPAPPSKQEQQQ